MTNIFASTVNIKVLLIGILSVHSCALQAETWIIGNAASAISGEHLYTERHYKSDATALISERVEYVSASGELIVEKALNGTISPITPEVMQTDLRTGTRFSIRDAGNSLDTHYQRVGEAGETEKIRKDEQLVIDAGFDPYVRRHWQALQNGKPIGADFFVPARMDTVRVSISKVEAEHCALIAIETLCLVVRPAGILRLVGWLVEPLYLAYGQDTQRLLMYRGISNLLDDNGKSQNVVIQYQYANANS